MWSAILTVVLLASIGIFVGGLVLVAAAVVPAFQVVPDGEYVRMHQVLDHYIERYMPWTAAFTLLNGLALLFLVGDGRTRALVGAGMVLTATVSAISQFGNVPLNKRVKTWRPEAPPLPVERRSLVARWRYLHLARVAAGVLALLAFASSAVMA
jgi:hypothetical protein